MYCVFLHEFLTCSQAKHILIKTLQDWTSSTNTSNILNYHFKIIFSVWSTLSQCIFRALSGVWLLFMSLCNGVTFSACEVWEIQRYTSGGCWPNDYMKYLVKIYVFWAPFQHCNLLNMTKLLCVVILPKCFWVESIPGGENGEENSRFHPQMIPWHDTLSMFSSVSKLHISSSVEVHNTYDRSWSRALYVR